jgi:hypothetical protein
LICFCLIVVVVVVDALGTGAADCPAGRAAVGGLHLEGGSSAVTQGTLEGGGIVVYLDGTQVSTSGASDNVITLNVGQTHRITIERTTGGMYFRGFLFRLGTGTTQPPIDTITVFSTDSAGVSSVGLAAICVSNYGVSSTILVCCCCCCCL